VLLVSQLIPLQNWRQTAWQTESHVFPVFFEIRSFHDRHIRDSSIERSKKMLEI
jgi:hypothetical protein